MKYMFIYFAMVTSFIGCCAMEEGAIKPFNNTHEAAVRRIALQNLFSLTCVGRGGDREEQEEVCDIHVMTAVRNEPTYVFEKDGEPVGFISYIIQQPGCLKRAMKMGPKGYINCLAVDDEHQRQGVGKALMQAALDDMCRADVDLVDVTTNTLVLEGGLQSTPSDLNHRCLCVQ